jgi:LmbE family N-acetylglucosaminyl deacetylase
MVLLCVSASLHLTAPAQIRPVYDQGALGLAQSLKRLNTTASVLMIGAHPDDEDTALLTYLARGENARTAYLSLTRGDGGQNILGTELGEALGVIRTEELLQARTLDGARQYFARAYDYGFSKTLGEAKEKWDEKVLLCDVVRVIRITQPLVVISVFNGTPADGHGQHQFAGYISPLAVKAAADPMQCAETPLPWTVKKFYVRHRGAGEGNLRLNTGKYDPLLGRSYFEIAMQARSQHRSQEQGVVELKGNQYSTLDLVESKVSSPPTAPMFDGIDTSIKGLLSLVDLPRGFSVKDLTRVDELARKALQEYDWRNPFGIVPYLAEASSLIEPVFRGVGPNDSSVGGIISLGNKSVEINNTLKLAAGVDSLVLTDSDIATPGSAIRVSVATFSAHPEATKFVDVRWIHPPEWKVTKIETPTSAGGRRDEPTNISYFAVEIPNTAGVTQPYWLSEPRKGDLYRWSRQSVEDIPFDTPELIADIKMEVGGKPFNIRSQARYRYADDIRGEIFRDLNVIPKLTVAFEKNLLIASTTADSRDRVVAITVTNNAGGNVTGKIDLAGPNGWRITSQSAAFNMTRKSENASATFIVTIPPRTKPGSYELKASAVVNNETYTRTMQTIAYEHIQTHRIYRPAKVDVKLVDLQVAPVRVGYIRGSGDRVPEAIQQLGLNVTEIDEATLASGDLSRFDTIVVGIRAYQVRPDVVANNKRLLDFANNGGTLIVQYQLPPTYSQRNLTPLPTQMGPRVVDENAVVTIAEPANPIFNFPNKITSDDFTGWVQERNLYNFVQMDPKYVGLLESHDTGEPENKGGLVVADIGKGKYIYCSYSLFRQLPAGVPGAYRLLANMLSLPKAQK